MERNSSIDWDRFDPVTYQKQNYSPQVRGDDARIIRAICGHFKKHFLEHPQTEVYPIGVDMGAGSNLYPMFTMLPWSQQIVLIDPGQANLAWLNVEISLLRSGYREALGRWEPYREALGRWEPYWDRTWKAGNPWLNTTLAWAIARTALNTSRADLLSLGMEQAFALGTMCFVAESMTSSRDEFAAAVCSFLRSLRPGAPYAIACMAESTGYAVGGVDYPAVPITANDLFTVLYECQYTGRELVHVQAIPVPKRGPLREGHRGMLLALGRTCPDTAQYQQCPRHSIE
jgi:hypothetical protein